METVERPKDWFFKTRKTLKKKPGVSIEVTLTESEARLFLSNIKSYKNKTLVRVASKITRKLARISHLRSVGLMEVLKNE